MGNTKKMVFETITNSYKPVRTIGQGGSGTVYEVVDKTENTHALKLLSPDVVSTDKAKRFVNELNFLSNSRHPAIVPVLDSGFMIIEGGAKTPFYVMPCYGDTLRKLIANGIAI